MHTQQPPPTTLPIPTQLVTDDEVRYFPLPVPHGRLVPVACSSAHGGGPRDCLCLVQVSLALHKQPASTHHTHHTTLKMRKHDKWQIRKDDEEEQEERGK